MITSIRLVPSEWCIMGSGEIGKEIEPLFCGVYPDLVSPALSRGLMYPLLLIRKGSKGILYP